MELMDFTTTSPVKWAEPALPAARAALFLDRELIRANVPAPGSKERLEPSGGSMKVV